MKKIITVALAGVLALSMAGCTVSDPGESQEISQSQQPTESIQSESVPAETQPAYAPEELESTGDLGDYGIEITGFELADDYSGAPAILVCYTFTNNSEDTTSAMTSVSGRAFQNGVQLDTAIIADSDVLNADDHYKDIQTGASIALKEAFLLTSDTAPVEFEITEWISFSDEKLGSVFEISEGGQTVLSEAPSGDVSGELGDYTVSVVSYTVSEDYEGSRALVVNLGYTNNSDSAEAFIYSIDCSAFQDGVELETAIITSGDFDVGSSQTRLVKPGAGIPVSVAYILTSETSPVSIEITEYLSFSDDRIETTINLA